MLRCAALALCLPFFVPAAAIAQTATADLTVNVSGLRNFRGEVILYLWPVSQETARFPDPGRVQLRDERGNNEPCDFPKSAVCRRTIPSLQNLTVSYTFHGVPDGDYAVFVVHDENNNGLLDRGLFHRPLEARGYSNLLPEQVSPLCDRVSFEQALFNLADSKTITVGLRYPPRW